MTTKTNQMFRRHAVAFVCTILASTACIASAVGPAVVAPEKAPVVMAATDVPAGQSQG